MFTKKLENRVRVFQLFLPLLLSPS